MIEEQGFDLEIDGITWKRLPGVKYGHNFCKELKWAEENGVPQTEALAGLFRENLWFLVYFGMRVPIANHPHWIQACLDVQRGPQSHTLDLWARDHGKTTIITQAETIRRILNNPEERVGIFSYSRPAALSILRGIKQVFEGATLLKACFPDVLWADPRTESPKWSETEGLVVKRKGFYKEGTLEAWGLIEGMPVGKHFSGMVFDDVETMDLVNSPEIMNKLKDTFDMSMNLGTADGWHKVIGTTYHHEGLLNTLRYRKTQEGEYVYTTRVKAATVDGTPNGASAYLPEKRLAELRINRQMFYSQQLLDPSPVGTQRLNKEHIKLVTPAEIPQNLFKFMAVDPAGSNTGSKTQDSWAIGVVGIEPYRDDVGASRWFILDLQIEPLTEAEAMNAVVQMFMRNGLIRQLGVEKVGLSSAESHIAKALHARGRSITLENKGLCLLRPAGRQKHQRIEAALSWPLLHGKIHLSTAVPAAYRERLFMEMDRFPWWHEDGLDMLSYIGDMVKDYRFGAQGIEVQKRDPFERYKSRSEGRKTNSWLYV